MLDKAWPPQLKEDSELSEKEKDVILLKHLLTWSTWPGFLKFFGKKTIKLDILAVLMLIYEKFLIREQQADFRIKSLCIVPWVCTLFAKSIFLDLSGKPRLKLLSD